MCDDESDRAAIAARARSHHKLFFWGSVGSIAVLFFLMVGIAGRRPDGLDTALARYSRDPSFWIVGGAAVLALVGLVRTRGFRLGRLDAISHAERLIYGLSALPGLVVFSVLFIILAFLGVWSQSEARINRDAEAVRRGVNRALDDR